MSDNDDPHFLFFAKSLERLLSGYGKLPKNLLEHQKGQMEALLAAEIMFRKALVRHRFGEKVYRGFLEYIHGERHNILAARPFYRERVETFKDFISPVLAARNFRGLYRFNINFQFINFCMRRYGHHFGATSDVRRAADEVVAIRKTIIEQNMPLAISRAKIFRSRTPASPHFAHMDSVQTACEGLVSAVDKFVGPFSKAFRSVIIGRATGNLIKDYSEPMLHFYPGDRRKIYRANKARRRSPDLDKIVAEVNTGLPDNLMTNADEIQQLLNANSHLSLDQPVGTEDVRGPEAPDTYTSCAVDQGALPDELVEHKDAVEKLDAAKRSLAIIERKALVVWGMLTEV